MNNCPIFLFYISPFFRGEVNKVMHYRKLFSGELEQLILIKLETQSNFNNYTINYQLEPLVKTKLYDLYPDSKKV